MAEPKPQEEPVSDTSSNASERVIMEKQDALDTIALERGVGMANEAESLQGTAHERILRPEDDAIKRDERKLSRRIREEQPPVIRNPRNKPPGPNRP